MIKLNYLLQTKSVLKYSVWSFRQTQLILLCNFHQLLVYMLPQVNWGFLSLPSSLCCIPTHCCPPLSFMFLISSPSPQSPHQFPSTPCWLQCEECSRTSSGAVIPDFEELEFHFTFDYLVHLLSLSDLLEVYFSQIVSCIFMLKENWGWSDIYLPDTK